MQCLADMQNAALALINIKFAPSLGVRPTHNVSETSKRQKGKDSEPVIECCRCLVILILLQMPLTHSADSTALAT